MYHNPTLTMVYTSFRRISNFTKISLRDKLYLLLAFPIYQVLKIVTCLASLSVS